MVRSIRNIFKPNYVVQDVNGKKVTRHWVRRYALDVRDILNKHSGASTYKVKAVK